MRCDVSVLERVQAVVAGVLEMPVAGVAPDAALADLAALDSLKLVEILAALDEEFRTHVPGGDLTVTTSVAELARLIATLPAP